MTRAEILKQKTVFISLIVPVFNEEKNLGAFIMALSQATETLSQQFEIILIDDGSSDHSSMFIEKHAATDSRIKLISLSRNFGKESALTAGLEHCQGDVAIMLDADFQHPLSTVPEFLEKMEPRLRYGLCRSQRPPRRKPSKTLFNPKFLSTH